MENGINSVLVFGDSILKGAVTGTETGHLFDVIEENSLAIASKKLGFELNNQSVFGNIITKGQRKLNKMMERGEKADIAIVEFGGNDCDYDWATVNASPEQPHEPRVVLTEFLRILNEMVSKLRENKITPVLMTMPPLVGDRWFEHVSRDQDKDNILRFVDYDPYKLYRNHETYNNALVKFAYEHHVQFVDMRMAMLLADDYRDLMCMDGIHPNPAGYKYMSEVWIGELPKLRKEF